MTIHYTELHNGFYLVETTYGIELAHKDFCKSVNVEYTEPLVVELPYNPTIMSFIKTDDNKVVHAFLDPNVYKRENWGIVRPM